MQPPQMLRWSVTLRNKGHALLLEQLEAELENLHLPR